MSVNRKTFFVLAPVLMIAALIIVNAVQADIGVTDTQSADHADIAVDSNGNVHIAYSDDSGTSAREIWYTMLDSSGITLIEDTRITVDNGADGDGATRPAIAVDSSNNVHIIWRDFDWDAGNSKDITYTKLNPYADDRDGSAADPAAITVVALQRLSNDEDDYIFSPRLAIDSDDNIHIVWANDDDDNFYYMKLDVNGTVQVAQKSIRLFANWKGYTDIAVDSNNNLHIVCADDGETTEFEVYYFMLRGSDGSTLIDATRITDDDGDKSKWTRIAVDSNDHVYIVFQDQRGTNHEIYYKKLDPGLDDQSGDAADAAAITLVDDTALTPDDGFDSRHPAISADPNCKQVHVIWEEDYDNIHHMILDINTDVILSETVLTNDTTTTSAYSTVPNIVVVGNVAHIVWTDDRDGGYDIYFTSSQGPACSSGGGGGGGGTCFISTAAR